MEPISVANFISERIAFCEKTQIEIANEIGLKNPNFLTMVKQGRTKLPLDRVGAFAKALDINPLELLVMYFKEYTPKTWDSIEPFFPSTSPSGKSAC